MLFSPFSALLVISDAFYLHPLSSLESSLLVLSTACQVVSNAFYTLSRNTLWTILHPFLSVKLSLIFSTPSPARWVTSNAFYTFPRPLIESSLMLSSSTPLPALRVLSDSEPFYTYFFLFVKRSLILFLHLPPPFDEYWLNHSKPFLVC